MRWLSLEALRIWLEHGPGRTLIGPASHAAFAALALRGDYAAGYRALRRILAVGEARGYEPDTSQARFLFAPLQLVVRADRERRPRSAAGPGRAARRGRPRTPPTPTTRPRTTCSTAHRRWTSYIAEVEAALAFVRRIGSEQTPRCSTATGGWSACCAARPVARREAVPATRYADNAWRWPRARQPRGRRRRPRRSVPAWRGTRRRRCRCYRPPGPLSDRGGPPAARAGPRRAGPRGRRRRARPRCWPSWTR